MLTSPSQDLVSRPAATAAGHELETELQTLSHLDLHELGVRWRQLLRSRPPKPLSRSLLFRLLAYKLQARACGDVDRETARYLERIERERVRRRLAGKGKLKAVPPVPPVPMSHRLKVGILLAREYEGRMHQVRSGAPDSEANLRLASLNLYPSRRSWFDTKNIGQRERSGRPRRWLSLLNVESPDVGIMKTL